MRIEWDIIGIIALCLGMAAGVVVFSRLNKFARIALILSGFGLVFKPILRYNLIVENNEVAETASVVRFSALLDRDFMWWLIIISSATLLSFFIKYAKCHGVRKV